MPTYETRITRLSVCQSDKPLYSEMTTEVQIVDDAGGEFVEVEQHGRADVGKVCIDTAEWPALRDAIDRLIADCRAEEPKP